MVRKLVERMKHIWAYHIPIGIREILRRCSDHFDQPFAHTVLSKDAHALTAFEYPHN